MHLTYPVGRVLVTAPQSEAVPLELLRRHLRLDTTDSDDVLLMYLESATSHTEGLLRRALLTQTWDLSYERFGAYLELGPGPVQSVTHIQYRDGEHVTRTLDASNYRASLTRSPAVIGLTDSGTWPTTDTEPTPITVRVVAGYGDTAAAIPAPIRQAIMLLTGHLYEHREATEAGALQEVPMAYRSLVMPYQVAAV